VPIDIALSAGCDAFVRLPFGEFLQGCFARFVTTHIFILEFQPASDTYRGHQMIWLFVAAQFGRAAG
jgi:hypothetical protein